MIATAPPTMDYRARQVATAYGAGADTRPRPLLVSKHAEEPHLDLWRRFIADGDRSARDALAREYASLVRWVVGRLEIALPNVMEVDDALSAGTVGLLKAIDHYDPTRGVRFTTYAQARIRGEILDEVARLSPYARYTARRARDFEASLDQLIQSLGRFPSDDEICQALAIERSELLQLMGTIGLSIVSIDRANFAAAALEDRHTGDTADLALQSLAAPSNPEAAYESDVQVERLESAIRRLDPREQLLLALYYQEGCTLAETAKILDISQTRVHQILLRSAIKLRALLRQARLQD